MTGVPPILADNTEFVRRMGDGWQPVRQEPSVARGLADSVAVHRQQLSSEFPGSTIIVSAGEAMVRNNDVNFPFRADSDFLWLTGCAAEGAILVMVPVSGGHDNHLFLPSPPAAGTPEFLRDTNHSEVWVGPSPDLDAWSAALAIKVNPLHSFAEFLDRIPRGQVEVGGRSTERLDDLPSRSQHLARVVSELRTIKDEWEISELRRAVDATVAGFQAVAAELPSAVEFGGERWLQGTFDRHARTLGNGPGYLSIVAAGIHSPIAHWTRCDGPIVPDQLVLLDAGVETAAFYTADVTRTFPAGGTFTQPQRQVHDLVQRAHETALAAVAPDRQYSDFHHAAMEVIAQGLDDWGLLSVSVDEALSDSGQHHRRYLVCGVGHHLGLDVHDCAAMDRTRYRAGRMRPGMVVTVEPGLYFQHNDATVPPELRGIGVRIEDDVLITDAGNEVLSGALPHDAPGLEKWVALHSGIMKGSERRL